MTLKEVATPQIALGVAVSAAALVVVETVLAFGTGYLPISEFVWIVVTSVAIALVSASLVWLLRQLGLADWLVALPFVWLPVFIFAIRGQTDPAQVSHEWGRGVRIVFTVLILVLTALMLRRRNDSQRRFALIVFAAMLSSSLALALRTLSVSAVLTIVAPRPERWVAAIFVIACAAFLFASIPNRRGSGVTRRCLAGICLAGAYANAFASRLYLPPPTETKAQADMGKPNVILIVLDTARRDAFSIYGSTNPTPAMEELAATGTTFTRAYSTGTYTLPSHASLFSGELPTRHGAHPTKAGEHGINPEIETLASALKGRGYDRVGFSANPTYLAQWTGLQQSFRWFWIEARRLFRFFPTAVPMRLRLHLADPSLRVISFWDSGTLFRSVAEGSPALSQPFFLFVNSMDAHAPYPGSLTASKQRYLEMVSIQDRELGTYMHSLKAAGQFDRSLIIVTADHGEFLGERGHWWHTAVPLYEPVLAIPLVVKFPGQRAAQQSDELVSLADLKNLVMATIEGRPWAPPKPRARVLAEGWWREGLGLVGSRTTSDRPLARAVYSGRLKLIEHLDANDELYDLLADPNETIDLFRTEPKVAQTLRETMLKTIGRLAESRQPKSRVPPTIPPEVLERMRSLGYIQ